MTGGLVQEFHHTILPSVTPLATVVLSVLAMLVSGIGSVSDNFQENVWIKNYRILCLFRALYPFLQFFCSYHDCQLAYLILPGYSESSKFRKILNFQNSNLETGNIPTKYNNFMLKWSTLFKLSCYSLPKFTILKP